MMAELTEPSVLNEPFPWPRGTFDPPGAYEWLRSERPVCRVTLRDGEPVWLVTRYEDVRQVLRDPRVSSDIARPGFPRLGPRRQDPAELRSFLRMDGSEHAVFRRLLAKNFMVKRVEALRPAIQRLVDDTIDGMLSESPPVDFVQKFGLPVPSTVLSWILGVKAEDHPFFNRATEELLGGLEGTTEAVATSERASDALHAYIEQLVADKERADDPGDDILGQMVLAARAGTCTRQDALNVGRLFIVAGHDTTASMTSTGLLTLLDHPSQLAELRRNPDLIPGAIEELLRYLTIVHLVVLRVAAEDIEIGEVVIPAGGGIIPLNFSANRDDAHYPEAAKFDIHRQARDHFAFGYGVHQCIGQPLARAELGIIFETLLRRVPNIRLAAPLDEIPFKLAASINGVFRLPVTW